MKHNENAHHPVEHGGFDIPAPAEDVDAPGPNGNADLGFMVYCAVSAHRAGISYATQEKRLHAQGTLVDHSWSIIAAKLLDAVDETISEKLLRVLR